MGRLHEVFRRVDLQKRLKVTFIGEASVDDGVDDGGLGHCQ